MNDSGTGQSDFEHVFDKAYQDKVPNFDGSVNIALVGKVSAGKSSLLNALFECDRDNPMAVVGSQSGITTTIHPYQFEDKVLIVDCPGLSDVRQKIAISPNDPSVRLIWEFSLLLDKLMRLRKKAMTNSSYPAKILSLSSIK